MSLPRGPGHKDSRGHFSVVNPLPELWSGGDREIFSVTEIGGAKKALGQGVKVNIRGSLQAVSTLPGGI